jgi:hypothetical protein
MVSHVKQRRGGLSETDKARDVSAKRCDTQLYARPCKELFLCFDQAQGRHQRMQRSVWPMPQAPCRQQEINS